MSVFILGIGVIAIASLLPAGLASKGRLEMPLLDLLLPSLLWPYSEVSIPSRPLAEMTFHLDGLIRFPLVRMVQGFEGLLLPSSSR